jgi:hypothetical protein
MIWQYNMTSLSIPIKRVKMRFNVRPNRILSGVVLTVNHGSVDPTVEVCQHGAIDPFR